MRETAVGNALSPTVDSRVGGTISADVDNDLSRCLELKSAVEVRHRDIPAPGYADSGRQEPTVCTQHAAHC